MSKQQYISVPTNSEMDEILNNIHYSDEVKRGLINLHRIDPEIKLTAFDAIDILEQWMCEQENIIYMDYRINNIHVFDSRQDEDLLSRVKEIILSTPMEIPSESYEDKIITRFTLLTINYDDANDDIYNQTVWYISITYDDGSVKTQTHFKAL